MLIEDSRKLDAAAWEGKVCGYSKESKYCRVWNPKTRRVVESKNVTFIETPPHLLPPPSTLSLLQYLVLPSWDIDDDTLDNDYISYDDLLRDVRDYTVFLNFTANIPANHENTSGVSTDAQVQEVVDQIRDFTRRGLLTHAASSPGAASPAEPLPEAVREPWEGGVSPLSGRGTSQKTAELSPAPVPAAAIKGAAMRNDMIHRANVVTRRAAAELTGAVTRYRGVRPSKKQQQRRQQHH